MFRACMGTLRRSAESGLGRLLPSLPAAVPRASSLLAPMFALPVRHYRKAGRGNGVWWQPLLPALAPELVPNTPGKGNRKKKMQQRRAQSVTDHARRKEGHRRAAIFRRWKYEAETDKVRQVYRDYAEILRAQALAQAPTSGDGSGGSSSSSGSDASSPPAN